MDLTPRPLSPDAPAPMQRSIGEVAVSYVKGPRGAELQGLRQQGSARAITLPGPEVVLLNTSGGLTGGDRQQIRLRAGPDTFVTATSQTAERIYKSRSGTAQIRVAIEVGARARLDWLPQETILFDHSAATRETLVELAADATFLTCETLVLGRQAMGEVLRETRFHDRREVRRAGRLVHFEPLHLSSAALSDAPAALAGARVLCSVLLTGPGVADALGPLRAILTEAGVRGAASAFDGRLTVRLMARDNWPLRRQLIRILTVLRTSPLPRVWHS